MTARRELIRALHLGDRFLFAMPRMLLLAQLLENPHLGFGSHKRLAALFDFGSQYSSLVFEHANFRSQDQLVAVGLHKAVDIQRSG